MEISKIDKTTFKLKGKTGVATATIESIKIESTDGSTSKIFTSAGEYEVAGISVINVKTEETKVSVYEIDGLRVCYLANTTKKLADNKVSALGEVDVLILPVNSQSIELLQQIESYYVLPFGYESDASLETFLKESGLAVQKINKFSIKKDDIVEDQLAEIIVL